MIIRECIVSNVGVSCFTRYKIDNFFVYCILRAAEHIACDIISKYADMREMPELLTEIAFS